MFTIELDHLTDFHSLTVNEDKLQNYSIFKISAKVRVCDFGQIIEMAKTSLLLSIHEENTRKSCIQLNLIIFTHFQNFAENEEKLQN